MDLTQAYDRLSELTAETYWVKVLDGKNGKKSFWFTVLFSTEGKKPEGMIKIPVIARVKRIKYTLFSHSKKYEEYLFGRLINEASVKEIPQNSDYDKSC